MPLALIPPGARKGNRFWIARGTVNGRRIEVSTETTDEDAARRFAEALEDKINEGRVPGRNAEVTFAQAVRHYEAWRWPLGTPKADQRRLIPLVRHMGSRPVKSLVQADLVSAAEFLKPNGSPSTRNREVISPAAIVLHYASENGWCPWLRVRLLKTPKPRTRAADRSAAIALLDATEGKKRLLLLWLFTMGDRISDTLRITWDNIDLKQGTVSYRMSKTQQDRVTPLDEELRILLANEEKKEGRLFPWKTRSGVYKWLRPLGKELGVSFTPHMARHSVGKWMNDSGAGLRTIMGKLGHSDPKSSLRYQAGDVEVVRAASKKMKTLISPRTKRGKGTRKAQKS